MPQNKPDRLTEPVHRAAEMYHRQMEYIREQLVAPRLPQRQMRLGDAPAEPFIEQVAQTVEEA